MRSHPIALASACLGVAACAEAPPVDDPPQPRPPEATCEAGPAQHLLGAKATGEAGAELIELTGARTLRWVPPRTAVTMDFRADRLTVSYDDDMAITKISCG